MPFKSKKQMKYMFAQMPGLAHKFLHGELGDELERDTLVNNLEYYQFFNKHHSLFEVHVFDKVDPRLEEKLTDEELVNYHTKNNRLHVVQFNLASAYFPLQDQVMRELSYDLWTTTVYDMVYTLFQHTCTPEELEDKLFMRAARGLIDTMCSLYTLQCSSASAELMVRLSFQVIFYIRTSMGRSHTHASTVMAVTMLHFNLRFHDVVYLEGITLWPCVFRNSFCSHTLAALRLYFGRQLVDKLYIQMTDDVDHNRSSVGTSANKQSSLPSRVLLGSKRRRKHHLNDPLSSPHASKISRSAGGATPPQKELRRHRRTSFSKVHSSDALLMASPPQPQELLPPPPPPPPHVFSSLVEETSFPPLSLDFSSLPAAAVDSGCRSSVGLSTSYPSIGDQLALDQALEQVIDSFGEHRFVDSPSLSLLVSKEEAEEFRRELFFSDLFEPTYHEEEQRHKPKMVCERASSSSSAIASNTTRSSERTPHASPIAEGLCLQWCS